MFYDIGQYAVWLLLALLVGGVVGWMSYGGSHRGGFFDGWFGWGAIVWFVGLIVAWLEWAPGEPGHWLELALLLYPFYIAGCFLGGWLKSSLSADQTRAPVAAPARAKSVNIFAGNPVSYPGARPAHFAAAAGVDDLTRVSGVSPLDQKTLNDIGVYRYAHVAAWNDANAAWVDHHLSTPGRVETDRWIADAKQLAAMAGGGAAAVSGALVSTMAPAPAPRVMDDPATQALLSAGAVQRGAAGNLSAEAASAAQAEATRQAAATAKADADRKAVEAAAAAKAEADRKAAEAAFAAKVEADRKAAEATAAAKADADRKMAEAAAAIAARQRVVAADAAIATEGQAGASAGGAVDASHPGVKPEADAADGAGDDLKLIKGVGPKNEKALQGLGVRRFAQIADWSADNATWVGHHMAFPGRIEREHWIPQAKLLAAGVDTAHSAGVKSGAIKIDDGADAPLSEADARSFAAAMPKMMAKVEGEDSHAGARPLGLAEPRGGKADDLKLIKGIGKQNEARLHGLGVWHFDQIAAWSRENVKWTGSYLAFPGRIDREEWIRQSKVLAAGGETEFAKRVEAGLVKTSVDDGSKGQGDVAAVETRE